MDSPRCTPSRADGTNGYTPSTQSRRSSPLVGPLTEPFLVPFQLTSPSGVAGPRALPATYQGMYASVGPGVRALACSFLGPAPCPNKLGRNS